MLIEQPPLLYRMLFRRVTWRLPKEEPTVYLTFDDGPIPEVTEWVLDTLAHYGVKATFFCVGDNVRKYPDIYRRVIAEGHRAGNHTMHHLQGLKCSTEAYLQNVKEADRYIKSDLFRPPHGHIKPKQLKAIAASKRVIMWDVITRDYNVELSGEEVLYKLKHYTRNGSIIVFHDSIRSFKSLQYALPRAIEWLQTNHYVCERL